MELHQKIRAKQHNVSKLFKVILISARASVLFSAVLAVFSFAAFAKDESKYMDLKDEVVARSLLEAQDYVKRDLKKQSKPLTSAAVAAMKVSLPDAEDVMVRGIITGTSKWCGLDGDEISFKPFIRDLKIANTHEVRTMILVILHAQGQKIAQEKLIDKTCETENLEALQPFISQNKAKEDELQ